MKKRVFSMILVLLILISLSISAVADDGFDVEQQENSDILEETINELNQNEGVLPSENEHVSEDEVPIALEPASTDDTVHEEVVLDEENTTSNVISGEGFLESSLVYTVVNENGQWLVYKDGVFCDSYTGIVIYDTVEFLATNGVLRTDLNGLVLLNETWFFVAGGQIQRVDGFAEYDNHWFIIKNGELDTNANGLYGYNGGTFLFSTGKLRDDVNGLWMNSSGKWYFLANGQVQTQHSGLTLYDGVWFYVRNGILAEDYTGYVDYDGSTFYVVNGQVAEKPIDDVIEEEEEEEDQTITDGKISAKGFLHKDSIGVYRYFVIVTNNTEHIITVDGNATAKDSYGQAVGAASMTIDVIGPGETSIGYFFFGNSKNIVSVDCKFTPSIEKYYYPVIKNLSYKIVQNDKNVTISVTNVGKINAQFVEAYAIFYNSSNKILDYSSKYITDKDSEIKPGATINAQLDFYGNNYDHVEIYFTGRSDGRSTPVEVPVSINDFKIEEHKYEDSIGTTRWFLIVKNNSAYDVGFNANGIAYDHTGKKVGAADASINIIGAGQTSICYFFFNHVTGIDHVDYQLDIDTDPIYTDVLHNLRSSITVNEKNVIVATTNNGAVPAEFVEGYCLFFDNQGEVIAFDSAYFTDSDYELKPGATLTKQFDIYGRSFAKAEVFFTGRHYDW